MRTEFRQLISTNITCLTIDIVLKPIALFKIKIRNLTDGWPMILDSSQLPADFLLERWTLSFDSLNHHQSAPELSELYKRIIVLMRAIHSTMRQLSGHQFFKSALCLGPYQECPYDLVLNISGDAKKIREWPSIPGTEAFEQTAHLPFAPVVTSHGCLKACVEHRANFDFAVVFADADHGSTTLQESFEEISKQTIQSPTVSTRSQHVSLGVSPASPGAHLGMGVPAGSSTKSANVVKLPPPKRSVSQGDILSPFKQVSELPNQFFASPVTSPSSNRRTRTSSILTVESNATSPIPGSLLGAMSTSVLGDSAITQFMKQCENRPALESISKTSRDISSAESFCLKRLDELADMLESEIEPWLTEFRAVESLSSPVPAQRSKADTSMQSSSKLPAVSPVIECPTPSDSDTKSDDYHLMFPL